jgi:hypothetical protein
LDHFLQFLELKIETDNMGQALPEVAIAHDLQLIPWVTLRSAEIAEKLFADGACQPVLAGMLL